MINWATTSHLVHRVNWACQSNQDYLQCVEMENDSVICETDSVVDSPGWDPARWQKHIINHSTCAKYREIYQISKV